MQTLSTQHNLGSLALLGLWQAGPNLDRKPNAQNLNIGLQLQHYMQQNRLASLIEHLGSRKSMMHAQMAHRVSVCMLIIAC